MKNFKILTLGCAALLVGCQQASEMERIDEELLMTEAAKSQLPLMVTATNEETCLKEASGPVNDTVPSVP